MNRAVHSGTPASPGTALGFAFRTDRPHGGTLPHRRLDDPAGQITEAFGSVARRMRELADSLRTRGQCEQADIMEVAGHIAADNDLRVLAIGYTEQGDPTTVAIKRAVDSYATMLASLDDPMLAERATDVHQIGRRVLAWLHGDEDDTVAGPLVLLAHEIGAADLLEPHAPVVAAASVVGGPNSHASIVARSLGIPLLLGIGEAVLRSPDGVEVLVDAQRAELVLTPDAAERAAALATMEAVRARKAMLVAERDLPSVTGGGRRILLRANVATPSDAQAALTARAEGVGLLRTELPFLDARSWPSYAQHTAALAPVFRRLARQPVTVRTLDFADDKLPPFLAGEGGRLGRGLPLMLAEPDAFADQLRAILTAGAATDLRIMIPMVASAGELAVCRDLLAKAAVDVGVAPPPLGAMIELPEAVAGIDAIAAAADFLSIGSNDLTCQILGLDRRDPAATPAMAAHPDVQAAIGEVVSAAHRRQLSVSVCGDAAAHAEVIPLLVGLGCDVLSVAPSAVDEVRAHVRRIQD